MANLYEVRQYRDKLTDEIKGVRQFEIPNYFDPEKGYRTMARTKNIRLFPEIVFPRELTYQDKGRLLDLAKTMWANTGVLGKVCGKAFKPFNDAELLATVNFTSERRGRSWLERMVKLSLLRSIDVNLPNNTQERQWFINPLHFMPMFITRQSYLVWRDQIDEFFPEWVVKEFGIKIRMKKKVTGKDDANNGQTKAQNILQKAKR